MVIVKYIRKLTHFFQLLTTSEKVRNCCFYICLWVSLNWQIVRASIFYGIQNPISISDMNLQFKKKSFYLWMLKFRLIHEEIDSFVVTLRTNVQTCHDKKSSSSIEVKFKI